MVSGKPKVLLLVLRLSAGMMLDLTWCQVSISHLPLLELMGGRCKTEKEKGKKMEKLNQQNASESKPKPGFK